MATDKFNTILNSITLLSEKIETMESTLTKKVDQLDLKLEKISTRISKLEEHCETKFEEIDEELNAKADTRELEELRALVKKLERSAEGQKISEVMRESYDKRFNVLIHGLPEDPLNSWETPLQTLGLIHKFMKEAPLITDPTMINVVDYHRLSQRPVFNGKTRQNRPIIIKLTNATDKGRIFAGLKNLKAYNEARRKLNQGSTYVTEHLPKKFQDERKLLLPFFNETRKRNQRAQWKPVNGHYALFIGVHKVDPPRID